MLVEHHHIRVPGPRRGPVGGVTPAQVVLAGAPATITTWAHRTRGRMSSLLRENRRHRHIGVRRQRDGVRLAMAGPGGPLEPIWDLAGEKLRNRIKPAKHLQQQ
jgi:hypothetical protein